MITAAIDEAGRGSLIGPLVLCGISVDEKGLKELENLGVKDSKLLTPKKREELEKKIKKIAEYHIVRISAKEIDLKSRIGVNLNKQEAIKMAECINVLKPDKAIIDAPSGIKKFVDNMKSYSEHECEIVAEHKADMKYVAVAAASILAKVDRDRAIKELQDSLGFEIGVGYPHDKRTISALKENLENKNLMNHVRTTWVTYSTIMKELEQKGLGEF